eukprot:gb/GEZN01019909.1/.p1 GENE.gb/GEZN01019909.1/~~gb/GEZN01019909.1/.p1  ORF type:complete len:109 (+),score=74.33 gb/GEZN01019909.1/:160-486(+)
MKARRGKIVKDGKKESGRRKRGEKGEKKQKEADRIRAKRCSVVISSSSSSSSSSTTTSSSSSSSSSSSFSSSSLRPSLLNSSCHDLNPGNIQSAGFECICDQTHAFST